MYLCASIANEPPQMLAQPGKRVEDRISEDDIRRAASPLAPRLDSAERDAAKAREVVFSDAVDRLGEGPDAVVNEAFEVHWRCPCCWGRLRLNLASYREKGGFPPTFFEALRFFSAAIASRTVVHDRARPSLSRQAAAIRW